MFEDANRVSTDDLPCDEPVIIAPPQGVRGAEAIDGLLVRIGASDARAFKRLYDMASRRLLARAMSIVGNREAAEDVLQDAFVAIWRKAGQFDPSRGSGSAWLTGIVRNAAIDRLRQDRLVARYQISSEVLPETPIAPEPVTDRLDLQRSLERLSPEQRATISLVVIQGWTHEEVATRENVPTPTAKARTRRGLARLRAALTEPDGDCKTFGDWTTAAA
jgi:RNA polymerase sigma-70 factor (ECF subfamily)